MVAFRWTQVAWQFQIPISFPAVKQELFVHWIRRWKENWPVWARCQKATGRIYCISRRSETFVTSQPDLEFDNFKSWLKSSIFKFISWLNVTFLWMMIGGVLKVGGKTYLMAQNSPLNSPIFFLWITSIVYGYNNRRCIVCRDSNVGIFPFCSIDSLVNWTQYTSFSM